MKFSCTSTWIALSLLSGAGFFDKAQAQGLVESQIQTWETAQEYETLSGEFEATNTALSNLANRLSSAILVPQVGENGQISGTPEAMVYTAPVTYIQSPELTELIWSLGRALARGGEDTTKVCFSGPSGVVKELYLSAGGQETLLNALGVPLDAVAPIPQIRAHLDGRGTTLSAANLGQELFARLRIQVEEGRTFIQLELNPAPEIKPVMMPKKIVAPSPELGEW